MFWSGNFIAVRELNFLLKEENVTLSQVLEADDILQECKADNKALLQFLTRPEILAELITLITEEPPPSVELSQQYRHAHIACEVLTSSLSLLSDRLSQDSAQMARLCAFVARPPPLNPLLASYFSKTVEMLLERSPKQDWYLYHIVCLRVLDFFKSRRDFLPGLLRHIATSAIAETFKYFIRLDDIFNKIIMEWWEEHQVLERLVGTVCGAEHAHGGLHNHHDHSPHNEVSDHENNVCVAKERGEVAAANAAALLTDLVATGCAADGALARSRTASALVSRLAGEAGVRALLAAMFTAPPRAAAPALVHGAHVLHALLDHNPEAEGERSGVELAVAPHLPLLHHALLHPPPPARDLHHVDGPGVVGAARLQVAALVARLAASSVAEVAGTLLTLGTAGVLLDLFFTHTNNNFLHKHVTDYCRRALTNHAYRTQHTTHLLVECDLVTRLMDAYEQNDNTQGGVRAGYMGHVVSLLAACAHALEADAGADALPPHARARWPAFRDHVLAPATALWDTPLGGSYPSDNLYEADAVDADAADNYDYATTAPIHLLAPAGGAPDDDNDAAAESSFLELVSQRGDDVWGEAVDSTPADAAPVLDDCSPWSDAESGVAAEGWASFEGDDEPYCWPYAAGGAAPAPGPGLGAGALASHLLTALSALTPTQRATLVTGHMHHADDTGTMLPTHDTDKQTDTDINEHDTQQLPSELTATDEAAINELADEAAVEKATEALANTAITNEHEPQNDGVTDRMAKNEGTTEKDVSASEDSRIGDSAVKETVSEKDTVIKIETASEIKSSTEIPSDNVQSANATNNADGTTSAEVTSEKTTTEIAAESEQTPSNTAAASSDTAAASNDATPDDSIADDSQQLSADDSAADS